MKSVIKKTFLATSIIFLFFTHPIFSQENDPKSLSPASGKALIYIVRPSGYAMAVKFKVSFDGNEIGATKGKKFLYIMVSPGKHTIISKANNSAQMEIDVEAGKTYFIKQTATLGITASNELTLLDETTGRSDLSLCKYAN